MRVRDFVISLAAVQWKVESKWAPARQLSELETAAARKIFFDLDADGSGSIDADELGGVMRSLGQNPTDLEIIELIKSVDEGECDGKIQLREFFTLYARGLDTRGATTQLDVNNIFSALGGDSREKGSTVSAAAVHSLLLEEFDLDVRAQRAPCRTRPSRTSQSSLTACVSSRVLRLTSRRHLV